MSKATIVAVAAALLLWPVIAWGQGKGHEVEVRSVSAPLQETQPGQIVSLSFLVTNRAASNQRFGESLELPAGWDAVIPSISFVLGPSESTTRPVAFRVPANAPADSYEVTYSVRSQENYAIQDEAMVTVVVLKVDELALLLEGKPETVIAGDIYQVKLRVINQGNAATDVILTVTSTLEFPASIEPAEVALEAGASEVVTVTVETEADTIRQRDEHVVWINAEADGAQAQVVATTELIPRVTREPDLHHRIPSTFTVYAIDEENADGFQGEWQGIGTLDEAGTEAVEFSFRGPAVDHGYGGFWHRDEYWLNYATTDWDVRVGDQSYGLSELTSYYQYGRGLELGYHPPELDYGLGTWFLDNRWGQPDQEDFAAYITHDTTDKLNTRFNFARQQYDPYGIVLGIRDTVWSVEGDIQTGDNSVLQLEYGRSDSTRDGGVDDDAYRIDLDGWTKRQVYYQVDKRHAGADYYGYWHDVDYTSGAVSFPIYERLRGRTSYSLWKSNIELRPARGTASKEDLLRLGLDYSLPQNWALSLDYDDYKNRDRLSPSAFDYDEDAIRLGVGRGEDNYSYLVELQWADRRDNIGGTSQRLHRYNVFATYNPEPTTFLSVFAGFGDDEPLEPSYLLAGRKRYGASARWKPQDDLSMYLWYAKYNYDSPLQPENSYLSFTTSYALPQGRELALNMHHYRDAWTADSDTSYMLSYSMPVGIAVGKKKSIGVLSGSIFDGGDPDRAGIVGAILTANGMTTVTDAEGGFAFPALDPGTYGVYVRDLGPNRVTESRSPFVVEVQGGQRSQLEIAVIEAARVSGQISMVNGTGSVDAGNEVVVGAPGGDGEAKEPQALPGILVELSCDGEDGDVVRTLTNFEGAFLFEGLRPGIWQLKVYDYNIPDYYYIENATMELELSAGETEEVSLRVLPKERPIRIIEEGEIETNNNE